MSWVVLIAAMDGWDLAQWGFNILYTVAIAYIASKSRKIEALEEKLEKSAEAHIDQQFKVARAEIQVPLNALAGRVDRVEERLAMGDGNFDKLADRDGQLERMLGQRFEVLKDWIHANCASKEDMRHLEERIDVISLAKR